MSTLPIPGGKPVVRLVPHVSRNSGQNEWYTPVPIVEAARKVMGGIDLDPATSELAQSLVVRAESYYTKETNGLSKEWTGRIWMNPPYSQDLIGRFIHKLVRSHGILQWVVLVNNATETKWGQMLLRSSRAVCFPSSRVKFIDINGKPSGTPLQGQMISYSGDNVEVFNEEFGKFGTLLRGN